MNEPEAKLLSTLLQLEGAVQAMSKPGPKPDVISIFEQLDRLTETLPPQTDPTLLHYLRKKSYQKARFWLEGRELENQRGACGPHQ